MNYKILQKIADELRNKDPRLDYVLGMIETLLSLQEKPTELIHVDIPSMVRKAESVEVDPVKILESGVQDKIKNMKL